MFKDTFHLFPYEGAPNPEVQVFDSMELLREASKELKKKYGKKWNPCITVIDGRTGQESTILVSGIE